MKSASHLTIIYAKDNHVAHITLNRSKAGNAVNLELAQEMDEVCRAVVQDDDVYVVVVSGAGELFCTGSELKPDERQHSPAASVASIDRPVIAAINGDALAEGLELALACDVRLASDRARFGLPAVARGLIPTEGGTQRLPRIVGRSKAMELLLTAESIDAREALEIGLVNRIMPGQKLASEAEALAAAMAARGPIALKYVKEAVNRGSDLSLGQGLRLEADLYFILHTTADRTEGIKAFLEKRPPRFKGK